MAIDSENKRASAANHFMFQIPPAPDNDIDTNADRAHLDVYSGIATASMLGFNVMLAAFASVSPGAAFISKIPGIDFTSKKPQVSFSTH